MPELPPLFDDPVIMAALVLVVLAVFIYQRTLTWTEYRQLHALKRRIFPLVDRYTTIFAVSNKGYRDDAEYVTTVDGPVGRVWRGLVRAGGSPHLINSLKRRAVEDGTEQLSAGHVLWTFSDGSQTECYLFANYDGTVDVYAHHEPTVLSPDEHLEGPQTDGDPRGVVWDALVSFT